MQSIWNQPFTYFMFMRFTTQEYAQAFLKTGSIKFSTPNTWVNYAKKPGMRGDVKEGTLAAVAEGTSIDMSAVNRIYGGDGAIVQYRENGKIIFKNKRRMDLPGFCFYLLKGNTAEVEQDISGKMFDDFTNGESEVDISKRAEKDKPAVILISRHDLFLDRLQRKLIELGVNEDEIIFDRIRYFDLDVGEVEDYKPPMELFCKDKAYSYQEEGRIIINTRNLRVLKRLRDPICLGGMSDAASVVDWYLPDGVRAVVKKG